MFGSGICPHCQTIISHATVEPITINSGEESYKGVTYFCPHCRAVLTVSMDQIALNADLVTRLLKALRKG